ncbi:TIGR01777 family oxidoreductase [Actinospica durhamensis]|uniref:TIGR01777 family oxidoreductase n=1 Tax=Actinospica durhamensis TaxID=1508375 RepID=A0A941EVL5_9ACTN|nr:TIGR01777 family oxidoreductase [Actinospica durhamensis]MBR7834754.1 TIGR01777 family oxidoreductase [Actinospica durhamensis]
MRVVITGSSGLIGAALAASLLADGHEVLRLVRGETAEAGRARWDPEIGDLDPTLIDGADAVVCLGGAGVGDHRWSAAYKQQLRDSRIHGTALLADTIAAIPHPPKVFVAASAIGYYGDVPDAEVDESSPPGTDFLAELTVDWEAAADTATGHTRVVHPRFGIVLASSGGAFGRMLPLAKAGLGGPLGGGRQYWSVISLTDAIRALRFAIEHPNLAGPVNLTCPHPVTNGQFARELGAALHRPAVVPAPAFALRLALGGFADSILMSQRVLPKALVEAGFTFEHPTAAEAIKAVTDGGAANR